MAFEDVHGPLALLYGGGDAAVGTDLLDRALRIVLDAAAADLRRAQAEIGAAAIGDATPEERKALERHLAALRHAIAPTGFVWISWPKNAAKVPTDITEDTIREVALPLGYVDVKVCAVDAVWSGLKLMIRKELR